MTAPPILALTQGDPAGIGPEILLGVLRDPDLHRTWRPLLVAERAALEPLARRLPEIAGRLRYHSSPPSDAPTHFAEGAIPVFDPVARARIVRPGEPTGDDARGALAALDAGLDLARRGVAAALVTAPLNKATIAHHVLPDFRGHTDYLASACGLERYGRDYLMAFLAPDLRVALLTTHLSLAAALAAVRRDTILAALRCLHGNIGRGKTGGGKIAVAALNPHAGEGGLMGREDDDEVRPAVEAARREGIDVTGPESADSLFARARAGQFDWVLALYHDQGLIAVKTVAFGTATNWTLGLPVLRTSVDHGTAYDIAGRGVADSEPLRAVVATTLNLVSERFEEERR